MTKLISKQSSSISGQIKVPGDKSISHRAIMFGLLAEGRTDIFGLLEGEDVLRTVESARRMGGVVRKEADGHWFVQGAGLGHLVSPPYPIDLGNSGTSARLLMGLIGGQNIKVTLTGDASLSKRPMGRVMTPLEQMGVTFPDHKDGCFPLTVQGTETPTAIEYHLPVASAQVKSAILLAGLNADGVTRIIEDHPTRNNTESMLRHSGWQVDTEVRDDGSHVISMAGRQGVLRPGQFNVPSDPSSSAFPVIAAILNKGSDLLLPGICVNERRDGLFRVLRSMGASLSYMNERNEAGEPVADLHVKGVGALEGIDVDPDIVPDMIDEFPALAMVAACAKGTTKMTGLAELRVKESDRLAMVAKGLVACGVDLEEGKDSLTIHGTGKPPKGGALIETALDHRIAMSFLMLGTVTDEPVTIDDGAPIETSFPGFANAMNGIGANISVPK